jgi:hypothetical protein
MLVACRLAGISALGAYYAGARVGAQCGPTRFQRLAKGRRDASPMEPGAVCICTPFKRETYPG